MKKHGSVLATDFNVEKQNQEERFQHLRLERTKRLIKVIMQDAARPLSLQSIHKYILNMEDPARFIDNKSEIRKILTVEGGPFIYKDDMGFWLRKGAKNIRPSAIVYYLRLLKAKQEKELKTKASLDEMMKSDDVDESYYHDCVNLDIICEEIVELEAHFEPLL